MAITQPFDFFVQWHLTEKCNLRCKHCYQTGSGGQEISLPEVHDVVSEVAEMLAEWEDQYGIVFSPSFNITGGEPFLRHDIFEILRFITGRGFNAYLLSNGVLIDREKAQKISNVGVRGVQVSIEGPKQVHEIIRGKGSFSSAMIGVQHLLDAGIIVTLNVTLSDINADYFMEMVELSSSTGVQRLGFSRLVPSGRGTGLFRNMLRKEKLKELYESILPLKVKGLEIVTGDPIVSQMSSDCHEDNGIIPIGGCAAGVSGVTILQDGTITPCRRLHVPIGNIRKDSLREVWATSKVLMKLRDRQSYTGKCRRCRRWASCRGCRAIAYAYSCMMRKESFLSEDPQCFIED
jgi:radical SAM protein with 4Fe4S-binding SPASM domain